MALRVLSLTYSPLLLHCLGVGAMVWFVSQDKSQPSQMVGRVSVIDVRESQTVIKRIWEPFIPSLFANFTLLHIHLHKGMETNPTSIFTLGLCVSDCEGLSVR